MNLMRGFRRLAIVLSVAVIGTGIVFDSGGLWSHAKIYATLTDGTTEVYDTWDLVGSTPYERDPSTRLMVEEFVRMPKAKDFIPLDRDPKGPIPLDPELKTFRVVRGPPAWSWEDFRFTSVAAGIVVLLWAGFFAFAG